MRSAVLEKKQKLDKEKRIDQLALAFSDQMLFVNSLIYDAMLESKNHSLVARSILEMKILSFGSSAGWTRLKIS